MMAQIGNFGKLIVFETSDSRILNFNGFQRTISGNWTKHERIGKKPKSEFLNPELQGVQFTITLDARHGVRPRTMMDRLTKAVEKGQVEPLVIGGAKVGSHQWKMLQISESWDVIYNRGEVAKATLNLTLEEYV